MPDVVMEVHLINLRYELRGFDAIRELKKWLDEHASSIIDVTVPERESSGGLLAEPSTPLRPEAA